jgi:hypothetical protein
MNNTTKDLIKYPVIGITVVVTLWLVKLLVGINFSNISEVSKEGVKFYQQQKNDLTNVSINYESQINELSLRLSILEEKVGHDSLKTNRNLKKEITANYDKFEIASDKITKISETRIEGAENPAIEGYIWIGNYDKKSNKWSRILLAGVDKMSPPESIKENSTYKVMGNMMIRKYLPSNDMQYYKTVPNLGIVPKNSDIEITQAPQAIDREYIVQYWVKIKYQN